MRTNFCGSLRGFISKKNNASRSALAAFCFVSVAHAYAADLDTASPHTFASAQDAAVALVEAAKTEDNSALVSILGGESREWISSGDPALDRIGLEQFVAAYEQKNSLDQEGDAKAILVIGDDDFPFAFPIIKTSDGWAFDPDQGKEELLDRRIGRNELNTIQTLLAIVDAQYEYGETDRDGDGLVEFAAKFESSAGERDGLYWPTADNEPLSPLGPLVSEAVAKGYGEEELGGETPTYQGYLFKPLLRQGPEAPGGARDYVIEGQPIGGFAALAYPAAYGNSGIMTFMVNQNGVVYQTDLGPETDEKAEMIESFDPGEGWTKVDVSSE